MDLTSPIAALAITTYVKLRPPHQRGPAYVRKLRAKLHARYRRKIRSPKTSAHERRIYRRLLNER